MNKKSPRFDAPFWFAILAGVLAIGTLTSFGLAAAAQNAAQGDGAVASVPDT